MLAGRTGCRRSKRCKHTLAPSRKLRRALRESIHWPPPAPHLRQDCCTGSRAAACRGMGDCAPRRWQPQTCVCVCLGRACVSVWVHAFTCTSGVNVRSTACARVSVCVCACVCVFVKREGGGRFSVSNCVCVCVFVFVCVCARGILTCGYSEYSRWVRSAAHPTLPSADVPCCALNQSMHRAFLRALCLPAHRTPTRSVDRAGTGGDRAGSACGGRRCIREQPSALLGCARVGARVSGCVSACARTWVGVCICQCLSVCVCVCVCGCVSECASMPESMRARVLERTLPPNRPPATSCVACCTGHEPLQPLAARRRLARRRGVCGFVR